MKVAILGANGQLGSDLCEAFRAAGDEVVPVNHHEVEVSQAASVAKRFRDMRPSVIVNTAAMHHVENCENEPERAYAINALGARNLAQLAAQIDSVLIHVSTDYVFDGCKGSPYVEDDAPRPLNVYGNSKLAGEYYVRCLAPRHFVVRTSALYGKHPCRAKGGLNFVELMLRLGRERGEVKVVDDEVVSPTFTEDLAAQIVALSRTDLYGLKHATAEGQCSWFEFAREIFALADVPAKLRKAEPGDFPAKVARPKYSVLENSALKRDRFNRLRSWREGLAAYLDVRDTKPPTARP